MVEDSIFGSNSLLDDLTMDPPSFPTTAVS
jgi:hypothetical protein